MTLDKDTDIKEFIKKCRSYISENYDDNLYTIFELCSSHMNEEGAEYIYDKNNVENAPYGEIGKCFLDNMDDYDEYIKCSKKTILNSESYPTTVDIEMITNLLSDNFKIVNIYLPTIYTVELEDNIIENVKVENIIGLDGKKKEKYDKNEDIILEYEDGYFNGVVIKSKTDSLLTKNLFESSVDKIKNEVVNYYKKNIDNDKVLLYLLSDKIHFNYLLVGLEEADAGGNENNIVLDYSTYQLYYNSDAIKDIKDIINNIFKKQFQIKLERLLNILNKYKMFEIITTLGDIIENNTIIYDRNNFPRYLKENNNIYFLVDNINIEGNQLVSYYTKNSILNGNESFELVLDKMYLNVIPDIIVKIFQTEEPEKIRKLLLNLPSNIIEKLLENSIIAKEKNINKNKMQRDIILNFYKNYYKEYILDEGNKMWICSYLYYDTYILRCLKDINKGWINCTEKDLKFYNEKKEEEEEIVKKKNTNQYGYYGKFNKDNFCITEVDEEALKKYEETGDARDLKTGVKCNTGQYQKPGLLKLIINVFKLPIPDENRTDINNNKIIWKEIKDKNVDKLKFLTNVNKYLNEEQKQNIIKSNDETEINRIYYFIRQNAKTKCQLIKEFLEEKNLLLEDQNCGIQGKNKIDKVVEKENKENKEKKEKEKQEKKARKEKEKEKEKEMKKKEKEGKNKVYKPISKVL